jgi:hypothetical protein
MKQLIQNLGLILFFIAIVLLVFGLNQDRDNNTYLIVSGLLMLTGLVVHVIANKRVM